MHPDDVTPGRPTSEPEPAELAPLVRVVELIILLLSVAFQITIIYTVAYVGLLALAVIGVLPPTLRDVHEAALLLATFQIALLVWRLLADRGRALGLAVRECTAWVIYLFFCLPGVAASVIEGIPYVR